jgi:hypothetical protein
MKVFTRFKDGKIVEQRFEPEEFDTPEYQEKERQERERWFEFVKKTTTPEALKAWKEYRESIEKRKREDPEGYYEDLQRHADACESNDD